MSTSDPYELIEQYLERVKVYLPYGTEEETLAELRTHLLEEAERIGNGRISAGSAMMAIERLGDPKAVANEYAGSGEKVGPLPTEYVEPVFRILLILTGISLAFIVGAVIVGFGFATLLGETAFIIENPLAIALMIAVNLIIVFAIIGGLSLLDRNKPMTEKTTMESILGVGSDSLKPKPRTDAIGDLVMSSVFIVVLLHPAIQALYTTSFSAVLWMVIVFLALSAVKGALFTYGGENNFNLVFEAGTGFLWVLFAMVLVNVGWPTIGFYAYSEGVWEVFTLAGLDALAGLPISSVFTYVWIFIIFVIVVSNIWRIIAAAMKVPIYMQEGKGLWWKGSWGDHSIKRRPLWKRLFKPSESSQEPTARSDGYEESDT